MRRWTSTRHRQGAMRRERAKSRATSQPVVPSEEWRTRPISRSPFGIPPTRNRPLSRSSVRPPQAPAHPGQIRARSAAASGAIPHTGPPSAERALPCRSWSGWPTTPRWLTRTALSRWRHARPGGSAPAQLRPNYAPTGALGRPTPNVGVTKVHVQVIASAHPPVAQNAADRPEVVALKVGGSSPLGHPK
jgi:hypothetical protein